RAAAATNSFCVDAGARARSPARAYAVAPASCTTRQLRTPPSAPSRRAVRRATGSAGSGAGAGALRAVAGGAVGGGGGSVVGSGATVVVVVDGGGAERTSAAERAGEGRSTSTAPDATVSAAIS